MQIFELLEGYTLVWRYLPHRQVEPSVSVYCFYVVFVIIGGGRWRGFPSFSFSASCAAGAL